MQVFPGPRFLAKLAFSLFAQLPQPRPGAICAAFVRGEICQVFADQSIDAGVALRGMAPNGVEHVLIQAESDVLHEHSICVTVQSHKLTIRSSRDYSIWGSNDMKRLIMMLAMTPVFAVPVFAQIL